MVGGLIQIKFQNKEVLCSEWIRSDFAYTLMFEKKDYIAHNLPKFIKTPHIIKAELQVMVQ